MVYRYTYGRWDGTQQLFPFDADELMEALSDELIADGDLMLCPSRGVAWQADMAITATYDQAYFDKYRGYEGQPIARAINAGRVALVDRHFGSGWLLDVGVGSGEFIRARGANTFGYDVNPAAEAWLRAEGRWANDLDGFRAYSFWDVLEHVPDPDVYLGRMVCGDYVFVRRGTRHRIACEGSEPVEIIEVQVGDSFDEDAITRYSDDYNRV